MPPVVNNSSQEIQKNRPFRAKNLRLILKKGLDEPGRVEGLEIFDLFADADVFYRKSQFGLNADDDAALGGAVEFGQHDAGDIGRFLKNARLLQPVLSRGRVQVQERFMGGVGLFPRNYAANLF